MGRMRSGVTLAISSECTATRLVSIATHMVVGCFVITPFSAFNDQRRGGNGGGQLDSSGAS